jgi:hypothetical protein
VVGKRFKWLEAVYTLRALIANLLATKGLTQLRAGLCVGLYLGLNNYNQFNL